MGVQTVRPYMTVSGLTTPGVVFRTFAGTTRPFRVCESQPWRQTCMPWASPSTSSVKQRIRTYLRGYGEG